MMKRYYLISPLTLLVLFLTCCVRATPSPLVSTPSSTPFVAATRTTTPAAISSPAASLTQLPSPTVISVTPVLAGTQVPQSAEIISAENVGRLTMLSQWGNGNVSQIRYSPDGRFLTVASSLGVYFYDVTDYSLLMFIAVPAAVLDMVISPDGKQIATSSFDSVFLFNIADEKLVRTFDSSAKSYFVHKIAFSPDGQMLADAVNSRVNLWDTTNGTLTRSIHGDNSCDQIYAIAFSPDGNLLATGGCNISIWTLDGTLTDEYGPHTSGGGTLSLAFSQDGRFLAEGTNESCYLWAISTDGLLNPIGQVYTDDYPMVDSMAISSDGKLLAAGTTDGLYFWQMSDGALIRKFSAQQALYGNSVAWSPDNKTLASGTMERGIEIWNVQNGELLHTLDTLGEISSLAWSPDGQFIAIDSERLPMTLRNAGDGTLYKVVDGDNVITAFTDLFDQRMLAQGLSLKTIDVVSADYRSEGVSNWRAVDWNVIAQEFQKLEQEQELAGNSLLLQDVALTRDGKHLAAGFAIFPSPEHSLVKIWQTDNGILEHTIARLSGNRIEAMSYSPDDQMLAVASQYQVMIWRVSDEKLLFTVNGPTQRSTKYFDVSLRHSVAWSSAGDVIAFATPSGSVLIISSRDGNVIRNLPPHALWATSVAFSPDGKLLTTASVDGTLRLWGVP